MKSLFLLFCLSLSSVLCKANPPHPGPQQKIVSGCEQTYDEEAGVWKCDGGGAGRSEEYYCEGGSCSHGCFFVRCSTCGDMHYGMYAGRAPDCIEPQTVHHTHKALIK